MRWRSWLAFAGLGCTGAFTYRGDWALAVVAAVCVLVPAVLRFRRNMAATRAALRSLDEMETLAASYAAAARSFR